MTSSRLAFALNNLDSGDWQTFERFASKFLVSELPNYRNMASRYGDKGRDGEVFCADEKATTLFQMSVSKDWKTKIKKTLDRLDKNFKDIRVLVYVTNQEIGPAADELKKETFANRRTMLDVRDLTWFVDRRDLHESNRIASEELAVSVVDPILGSKRVADRVGRALTGQEARIGLLHLSLDAEDKLAEKGLTKGCFEALALAALHDTDSDNRLTAAQVVARVGEMLPAVDHGQVAMYVENALSRLSRRGGRVKYRNSSKEYSLSFEEVTALKKRVGEFMIDEGEVEKEIEKALIRHVERFREHQDKATVAAGELKEILEEALLAKGEAFAARVAYGESHSIDEGEFKKIISRRGISGLHSPDHDQVLSAMASFLTEGREPVQAHLRKLADAYTLFAFLRQTPDVQKAVVRMFGEGQIWLDTSAVLPLIVESLVEPGGVKRYTSLVRAVTNSGLSLYITQGVAEEINSHLSTSLTCARVDPALWESRIPFVYAEYIAAGRSRHTFGDWLEDFRGRIRPIEDIMDYLNEEFGIVSRNLHSEVEKASPELRTAAAEYWHKIHDRRRARRNGSYMDPGTVRRLVDHDVECSLGVMMLRRHDGKSDLGHKQWWLCLDSAAKGFGPAMRDQVEGCDDASPVLNPDFLSEYLRIGPLRGAIDRELRVSIPALTEFVRKRSVSTQLVQIADRVRLESEGKPERVIRRRVRDALDEARMKFHISAESSIPDLDEEIGTLD